MSQPNIQLILGDCLEIMRAMPSSSVDAVCTDPPAGIKFMGKEFDHDRGGRTRWIAWLAALAEAYRIAKPGTYALVWALPRTSHWTATAVEDAGWTIRDVVTALNGQGYPKSRACLKPCSEHWVLAYRPTKKQAPLQIDACRIGTEGPRPLRERDHKPTNAVCFGQAVQGSVAVGVTAEGRWPANVVLSHSEGCRRVGTRRVKSDGHHPAKRNGESMWAAEGGGLNGNSGPERYMGDPDGLETVESWECEPGCAVRLLDEMSGSRKADWARGSDKPGCFQQGVTRTTPSVCYDDYGGASRFFYTSKASRSDRGPDNTHPTVKSTDLMRWLCRLITPPGGTILDPFAGSGSTAKAAAEEGFGFIGIESDPAYLGIAGGRLEAARDECPLFPFPLEVAP